MLMEEICLRSHLVTKALHLLTDILARLSSNIIIRDTISNQLISTVLDGSFVITYLIILFSQSATFAWLALVIGLLQVVLLIVSTRVIGPLAKQELLTQGKFHGYAAEVLQPSRQPVPNSGRWSAGPICSLSR